MGWAIKWPDYYALGDARTAIVLTFYLVIKPRIYFAQNVLRFIGGGFMKILKKCALGIALFAIKLKYLLTILWPEKFAKTALRDIKEPMIENLLGINLPT